MKSLTIIGFRWFDRKYGNTYHTVKIIVDGREVHKSEVTYGYGSAYEDTAITWLASEKYLPKREQSFSLWRYCSENGIAYVSQSVDVPRKRDL